MNLSGVHKALAEFAMDKTFTKDAMASFNIALEAVKKLEDENIALTIDRNGLRQTIRDLDKRVEELKAPLLAFEKREQELLAREKAITHLEKDSACANIRAETLNHVFDAMFKNTIVREKLTNSVYENVNGPQGYHTNNKTTTDEKVTETE